MVTIGRLLLLSLGVVVGLACGAAKEHDAVGEAEQGLDGIDRQAYEETIERLEEEVRRSHAEILELRDAADEPPATDCEDLRTRHEAEMAATRDELARYRRGLERAVEELNRTPRAVPVPVPAPRPQRERGAGYIASRLGPYVQLLDGSIYVYGELWSYRSSDTQVRLEVELLEDGRVIQATTLDLRVPAHTNVDYGHTFTRATRAENRYTARVTPRY